MTTDHTTESCPRWLERMALQVRAACGCRRAGLMRLAMMLCLGGGMQAVAGAAGWAWQKLEPLPDPAGRAGLFAGTSGSALLVAGGANFPERSPWEGGKKVWHDDIFVLEKPNGCWRHAGKLPRPLAYGVSLSTPEGLICLGGSDAQEHGRDAWLFSWRGNALRRRSLPPLPVPLANACGVVLGSTIYLAGGSSSPEATQALGKFWSLEWRRRGAVWVALPPWPGPARMLAVAARGRESMILAGGVDLAASPAGKPIRRYLRDAYQFRPGHGWGRLADLPWPVAAAPSPAPSNARGDVLVLGGDDGGLMDFEPKVVHPGFRAEILRYDVQGDRWDAVGEMPAPRVTLPVVCWRGRWILPSGERRPGVRSPEVWSLRAPDAF